MHMLNIHILILFSQIQTARQKSETRFKKKKILCCSDSTMNPGKEL